MVGGAGRPSGIIPGSSELDIPSRGGMSSQPLFRPILVLWLAKIKPKRLKRCFVSGVWDYFRFHKTKAWDNLMKLVTQNVPNNKVPHGSSDFEMPLCGPTYPPPPNPPPSAGVVGDRQLGGWDTW